jgi:hypothetical protein
MNPTALIQLAFDDDAALVIVQPDGTRGVGVVPVRAYPLSRPDGGISLVDHLGHEAAWIADPKALDPSSQDALARALRAREFRPIIQQVVSVSTFATPSTWQVVTDRGPHEFILKAEEDIRRLDSGRLLVTSKDGVNFEIQDRFGLDRASRKLLERFL